MILLTPSLPQTPSLTSSQSVHHMTSTIWSISIWSISILLYILPEGLIRNSQNEGWVKRRLIVLWGRVNDFIVSINMWVCSSDVPPDTVPSIKSPSLKYCLVQEGQRVERVVATLPKRESGRGDDHFPTRVLKVVGIDLIRPRSSSFL